ncbi:hypothetical protein F4810DRAFT_106034 [Camillea tinctor]|nr:hypothetical protein F4810DRAFT_106034 [Camillea tinctor]
MSLSGSTLAAVEYLTDMAVDFKAKGGKAIQLIIDKDPEMARKILNLLLVPDFKPAFYDDIGEHNRFSGSRLDDIDLLDSSYSSAIAEPGGEEGRYPIRMIDLDTKNFVNYPEIGDHGQYCILSHSWKGQEIDYKYLTDAYSNAISQKLSTTEGLIDIAMQKCKDDIAKQEELINSFAHDTGIMSELGNPTNLVEKLLSRRIDVQVMEKKFKTAKQELEKAIVARDNRAVEDKVFEKVFSDIGLDEDAIKRIINDENATNHTQGTTNNENPAGTTSDDKVQKAKDALDEAEQSRSKEGKIIKFFESSSHVREAVDNLIGQLQQYKSMHKIKGAAGTAKDIFDSTSFPKTEKRYLWIDSCCINKSDGGEYVKSMASMGEWYKNAEFCLVHLDTPRGVPGDALVDWRTLKEETSKSDIEPKDANINTFDEIGSKKPEWSTRAWTLQELVMSKSTFYVNSRWARLRRPVENLGRWYYFSPFLSLYTDLDDENAYATLLEDDFTGPDSPSRELIKGWRSKIEGVVAQLPKEMEGYEKPLQEEENKTQNHGQLSEAEKVEEAKREQVRQDIELAQKIIHILYALNVQIPTDIDLKTAIPAITRSVYAAVQSKESEVQDGHASAKLLSDNLVKALSGFASNTACPQEKLPQHAINILLKSIVKLIKVPILDDRQAIAKFGNVQDLKAWQMGLVQSNFSAQKVMTLVCPRDAQVLSDRAYCLMGMLGVRFPVFPAEGLTKALSRLIDEVVTTSNDVSVFNWTGKHHGSPIRGRSLYPTSPEAFRVGKQDEEKKAKIKRLSDVLQIQRSHIANEFNAIWRMLRETQEFLRDRNQHDIPLELVAQILLPIKLAPFKLLKPHIQNLDRILKYIKKAYHTNARKIEKVDQASPASPMSPDSYFSTSSVKSLTKDLTGLASPSFGLKRPSFKSFRRTDSAVSLSSKKSIPIEDKPADVPSPTTCPESPSLSDRSPEVEGKILAYVKSIRISENEEVTDGKEVELPAEITSITAFDDTSKGDSKKLAIEHTKVESLISPNPIIITNSGIEGTFDIQRVIISFENPEKLRRQVENAVSPNQKISGWCVISTGFAVTLVSFSCPKHILEKQLDVAGTVEERIDNEDESDDENSTETPAETDTLPQTGSKEQSKARGVKRTNTGLKRLTRMVHPDKAKKGTDKPEDKKDDEEEGQNRESRDAGKDEKVEERELNKVVNMIKFVQEPELTSIAGEWVLVRFSGVPGANWFLCYLELGASKGNFHGHRIATDEIDFRNASPEPGLTKCWESYMALKKRKLCSVLQKLVDARDWNKVKDEAKQEFFDKVTGAFSGKGNGADGQHSVGGPSSDSDSESDDENVLMDVGQAAIRTVGSNLIQRVFEMRSERAAAQLQAYVLNQFPRHIQPALKSLDDKKDLMPSMFHAAKKIHMF